VYPVQQPGRPSRPRTARRRDPDRRPGPAEYQRSPSPLSRPAAQFWWRLSSTVSADESSARPPSVPRAETPTVRAGARHRPKAPVSKPAGTPSVSAALNRLSSTLHTCRLPGESARTFTRRFSPRSLCSGGVIPASDSGLRAEKTSDTSRGLMSERAKQVGGKPVLDRVTRPSHSGSQMAVTRTAGTWGTQGWRCRSPVGRTREFQGRSKIKGRLPDPATQFFLWPQWVMFC